MSYFVINKKLDYDRGFLSGGEFRDGRLFLKEDCRVKACFFSRLFDSREAGTEWGRFTADSPGNTGARSPSTPRTSPSCSAESENG